MLKKTVKYTSLDGEEVTEDLYFNLSKAELIEMELSFPGGLSKHLERVSASEDGRLIITTFKDILKKAYGKRSEDGKRFIKNDEIWEEFVSSEAYSEFFTKLVTDADAAAEFVNGVVPHNLEEVVAEIGERASAEEARPGGPKKLTPAEIVEMDSDELKSGLAAGRYTL